MVAWMSRVSSCVGVEPADRRGLFVLGRRSPDWPADEGDLVLLADLAVHEATMCKVSEKTPRSPVISA